MTVPSSLPEAASPVPGPPSDRAMVRRSAERARYDEDAVHAVLDEGLVAHVGIAVAGRPFVLPMVYARRGDRLLLHASVASRLARHLGSGAEVCVTVTLLDGLVLARSAFHHSMNYRSVVVLGRARRVDDPGEVVTGFDALVDHVAPGRSGEVRPADRVETRQTMLLEVPLAESSVKVRTGPPRDDDADLEGGTWGGVVPVTTSFGPPEADPHTPSGAAVPASLVGYARPPTSAPLA